VVRALKEMAEAVGTRQLACTCRMECASGSSAAQLAAPTPALCDTSPCGLSASLLRACWRADGGKVMFSRLIRPAMALLARAGEKSHSALASASAAATDPAPLRHATALLVQLHRLVLTTMDPSDMPSVETAVAQSVAVAKGLQVHTRRPAFRPHNTCTAWRLHASDLSFLLACRGVRLQPVGALVWASALVRRTVLAAQAAWLLDLRRYWARVSVLGPQRLDKLKAQLTELVDDGRPPLANAHTAHAATARTSPRGALVALWHVLGRPLETAAASHPSDAGSDAATAEHEAMEAAARVVVLGHALLRRCGGRADGWYALAAPTCRISLLRMRILTAEAHQKAFISIWGRSR
jgi:hypothetical protein